MTDDTTPFGDLDDATAEALMAGAVGTDDSALGALAGLLDEARLLSSARVPEALAQRHVAAAARLASRSGGTARWIRRAVAVGAVGAGLVGGAAAARHALFDPQPEPELAPVTVTVPDEATPDVDAAPPTSADPVGPGATVDLDTCLEDPDAAADSSALECDPTSGGQDLPAPVSTIPPVDTAQAPSGTVPELPGPTPGPQPTGPDKPDKDDSKVTGDEADLGDDAGGSRR